MSNTRKAVLAAAKPATRSVPICMDGELVEAAERAEAAVAADPGDETLAAERDAVYESMSAATFTFVMRALSPRAWSDLLASHPARKGKTEAFNAETFPTALIAACCVEPADFNTIEAAQELWDAIPSEGQRSQLFDAGFQANIGAVDLPKSVLASLARRSSGPSSTTRARAVSLAPPSSAAS